MRSIHVLLVLLISTTLSAQISHGGEPMDWGRLQVGQELLPTLRLAPIDLTEVIREDSLFDQDKTAGYRFGVEQVVDVDILASADLEIGSDGSRIYRYAVESQGALSLSFLLTECHIVEGGRLYLWTAERDRYLGAFTSENNKPGGMLAIGLLPSDRVVFEYHLKADASDDSRLRLGEVVHGYRPMMTPSKWSRGPFGNSGQCNIDVLCPEGLPYSDQIRSVALIVSGGNAYCSGALIANTTGDDTPYFLTADHCFNGGAGDDPTIWVFYFGHQSAVCDGFDGPIDQSISGGDLLIRSIPSDVALIQLSSVPPESYEPYYAGWNASTSSALTSSTYSIHHPSGDVKKICFDFDPPTFSSLQGRALWRVEDWDLGVTEGGSSGAPLFGEDSLIIGQLFGGQAACVGSTDNDQFDVYGRFGVSYGVLSPWLDPDGTFAGLAYPGRYVYSDPGPLQAQAGELEIKIQPSITDGNFVLRYNQLAAFEVEVFNTNGQVVWTGSFEENTLHNIDLRGIVPKGIYIFSLSGPLGNYTIRGAYVKD